jgi:hypothetical protein
MLHSSFAPTFIDTTEYFSIYRFLQTLVLLVGVTGREVDILEFVRSCLNLKPSPCEFFVGLDAVKILQIKNGHKREIAPK